MTSDNVWYMSSSLVWFPPEENNYNTVYGPVKNPDRFLNLMEDDKRCVSCGKDLRGHQEYVNDEKELMCKNCFAYYTKKYVTKW